MANDNEKDLLLSLKKANSERSEKRKEMMKIGYYQKLFKFLEARFSDGETYSVKNYFTDYKMVTKDQDGNDKTVYGFMVNDRTYLSFNDISFPKKLFKRTISRENDVELIEYSQMPDKVYQGDLAQLFEMFKNKYDDSYLAFELLYIALAKCNESKFMAESFVYPTETFICFKGNYVNSNFYMFNLKSGGTEAKELKKVFDAVCEIYDKSLQIEAAEAEAEP